MHAYNYHALSFASLLSLARFRGDVLRILHVALKSLGKTVEQLTVLY